MFRPHPWVLEKLNWETQVLNIFESQTTHTLSVNMSSVNWHSLLRIHGNVETQGSKLSFCSYDVVR